MKKYWFFDLDGTLADTDADIRSAWKAAIKDLSLDCPHFDEEFIAGPPIDEMTKALFPGLYTQELADAIRVRYAEHYDNDGFPETYEYPGIIDVVKKLKNAGAKVFIATNKRYAGALKMASSFGWDKIFDGVYAGDMYRDVPEIGKMKKGKLLAYLMNKLNATAEECVMVGDTCNDFDAAAENSMMSIGVRWGYGSPTDKPTRWVEKPEEFF
jgi:phosphoglycolate phosphatase